MARKLIVRITHGPTDAERAVTGLVVAAAAVASGVDVEVWLMNDAVELAQHGVVEALTLAHAPPVTELWTHIAGGGTVYVCSPCLLRRDIDAASVRDGVTPAGATALVASLAEDGAIEVSF